MNEIKYKDLNKVTGGLDNWFFYIETHFVHVMVKEICIFMLTDAMNRQMIRLIYNTISGHVCNSEVRECPVCHQNTYYLYR